MNFPRLAKPGGPKKLNKRLNQSIRVIKVLKDKNNLAQWVPTSGYRKNIKTFIDGIVKLSETQILYGHLLHPLLGISAVTMTLEEDKTIFEAIYGHRQDPQFAFGQLLTYLGMRSKIKDQMRTLTFDPDGWNRMGYRLVKGGDSGGKPTVVFIKSTD
jgi:hypothetical protein